MITSVANRLVRTVDGCITRGGKPVARLVALQRPPVPLDELQRRWARLPQADPVQLRRDIDAVIDPSI